MAKSKSQKSKNSLKNSLLLSSGRPIFSYVAIVFMLAFVGGGGYLLRGYIHAAPTPEVQLAVAGGKFCLDDNGNRTGYRGHPNKVDIWTCNGSAAQHWEAYGQNVANIMVNNQCLDVAGQGTANGSKVDLFPCNGGRNQQWTLQANGSIRGVQSGKCLDDPGFSQTNGRQVDIWACNGGANQRWSFTAYGNYSCAGDSHYGNYNSVRNYSTECQQAVDALAHYGYGGDQNELFCVSSIYNVESGWDKYAANASGAYGIPQALPGSKMSSAGADWKTNSATQIRWGVGYMKATYHSPCGAWSFHKANGYY